MRISDWSSDVCSSDLGRAYYLGRLELEIPLGSGARELGLRPSLFLDAGALFDVTRPLLQDNPNGVQQVNTDGQPLFIEIVTQNEIGRASCRERGCQYV